MKKIEAIIKPFKLEESKTPSGNRHRGMTVSEVKASGGKRPTEIYRGSEYTVDFSAQNQSRNWPSATDNSRTPSHIVKAAKTGKIGDRQSFRLLDEEALRIRRKRKANRRCKAGPQAATQTFYSYSYEKKLPLLLIALSSLAPQFGFTQAVVSNVTAAATNAAAAVARDECRSRPQRS